MRHVKARPFCRPRGDEVPQIARMAKQGGGVPPPVTVSVWAPPTDETQQKNWKHLVIY